MLIRWKTKDKDKCDKGSNQKQSSSSGSKKKRKFGGREGGNLKIHATFISFGGFCYIFVIWTFPENLRALFGKLEILVVDQTEKFNLPIFIPICT